MNIWKREALERSGKETLRELSYQDYQAGEDRLIADCDILLLNSTEFREAMAYLEGKHPEMAANLTAIYEDTNVLQVLKEHC